VASPFYRRPQRPPGIYRAARALRRASLLALILIILYVGVVAYSAVQVAKSKPSVGPVSTSIQPNGTVGVVTSFSLANPGDFPIQEFALHFRILNQSGGLLVSSGVGPTNVGPSTDESLPVSLYFPLSDGGASLLTEDQYLQWNVWGNASYGYLFSVSLGVETDKSWGAPFANLSVHVGTPTMMNGSEVVPVTVTFANDASFADAGSLNFQVIATSGSHCAQGSFPLDVAAGSPYDQTQNVAIATGCDPAGGHVNSQYVGSTYTITLPSEAIPP
jgi:hypothetical protein